MNISKERFSRQLEYVRAHARRVDRLALAYYGQCGKATRLDALSEYQNPDGGFGHAIEPDFRVPDSSVTATTIAFQYFISHHMSNHKECPVGTEMITTLRELDNQIGFHN